MVSIYAFYVADISQHTNKRLNGLLENITGMHTSIIRNNAQEDFGCINKESDCNG